MSRKTSALAARLRAAAALGTLGTARRSAPTPPPMFAKRQLAGQLLATLSPMVLAETGYLERRGGDRDGADPRSLRAMRLRLGAARSVLTRAR